MKGKSQENTENVREKGRRSKEKLAQQKELIFKTDLIQYSFPSIKRKNSCSKQLLKKHKLADLNVCTSTKCIVFHQLRKNSVI